MQHPLTIHFSDVRVHRRPRPCVLNLRRCHLSTGSSPRLPLLPQRCPHGEGASRPARLHRRRRRLPRPRLLPRRR
jgi:hypothetical protein